MPRIWKFGNDIDTDQIVPGRYAPFMRPNEDIGSAAFIEANPDFNQSAQPGDIVLAGRNFGCGSSREYAPLALKRREIGAIIAVSFARIFFRNAINLGLPVFVDEKLFFQAVDGESAQLNLENDRLMIGEHSIELTPLPSFARQIINAGGIVSYVREHGAFPEEAV